MSEAVDDIGDRLAELIGGGAALDSDEARNQLQGVDERLRGALGAFLPCEFTLELDRVAFVGDVSAEERRDGLAYVIKDAKTDALFCAHVPRAFACGLINACFGGSEAEPDPNPARALTEFDQVFCGDTVAILLASIWCHLTPDAKPKLGIDACITDDFDLEKLAPARAISATWNIMFGEQQVTIELVLGPQAFDISKSGAGEDNTASSPDDEQNWSQQIKSSLGATSVELLALTCAPELPLDNISNLRVGSIIDISSDDDMRITIECDGDPLFYGELGQKDGYFAVYIQEQIDPWSEMIADVLDDQKS